jgi:hypothetical protein
MTTAIRKTKTADEKLPLLQKGDRIRGTSPNGTQHAGTFEGYSSKDLILCKEGERTIALRPGSVEPVTESAPKLPTKITEVNSVAVYKDAVYYSESKCGSWRLASDEEIAELQKGDDVSEVELPWSYKFVKLGGDGTGDMVAICAFVDHPCFHYHIPVQRLQIPGRAAIAPATPLETLSAAIAALYADAEQAEATMLNAGKAALSLYLELGEKLIEAKGQVAHGQWLPWLEEQKIQERKAQRAIALFKGRAALEAKNDTLTDLTLTEALAIVSNRKLKTATPEEPQTENAPIPANSPPPEATAPDRVAEDVAPETEPLEGKNGAIVIDEYEYVEMSPRECWFDPGGGVVEGSAIAQNGKGFVRINWGEGRQSDVPGSRVSWSDPAITAVAAEIETGLAAIGLKVCRPSITPEEFNCEMWGDRPLLPNGLAEERPTGSQWLPEEVDHYARIQLQGLLKHLSPSELVKSAIVHSECSLVEVAQLIVSMANKKQFEAICDVLIKESDRNV